MRVWFSVFVWLVGCAFSICMDMVFVLLQCVTGKYYLVSAT